MRTGRRWQLDLESEVAVLPAPSKSTADDYAGIVTQGDDHAVGAVCDGVTGREGQGGQAAARALVSLRSLDWPESAAQRAVEQRLIEAVRRANAVLLHDNQPRRRNGSSPPTTTCTVGAVYVSEGRCYATAAWVGDSPAQVVTPFEMRPLTPPDQDHAASAPAALGVREEIEVSVQTVEVAAGQALLLHSDGFCLDSNECLRVYKNTVGDRHGWGKFLEQAMQRSEPSNDDKSALVIGIVGDPKEQPAAAPADEPRYAGPASGVRIPVPTRRRAPAGVRPAFIVPIVLVAAALGWLLGRGLPRAQPSLPPGVATLGERFAVSDQGAVLSLAPLVGAKGKEPAGGTWQVYTLEAADGSTKLIPAGRLSLVPAGSKPTTEATLAVSAPQGHRLYVDGRKAQEPVLLSFAAADTHKVELYSDNPPSKWGCEVSVTADGLAIKPMKARSEPK
jgi:serine/threonine protein phosphatase PrpC